ncbi:MAG: sulfotransferase, partial [Magnetococcales bacterium]|nr:sulfotransferase [Magnetococcales bacterium]
LRIGKEYINEIIALAPKKQFIIDKLPQNFIFIGIIKLFLPNAKIIHSARTAEDTCLSIFRTNFKAGYKYTDNLAEIGKYYRLYLDLISHWNNVFPGDIYNCQYEKLISNQEKETKKLLAYCGLGWNESCLNFHKTKRDVKTASNYQVRQPIYKSSVGYWKEFEKQLQPLITALEDMSSAPNL